MLKLDVSEAGSKLFDLFEGKSLTLNILEATKILTE